MIRDIVRDQFFLRLPSRPAAAASTLSFCHLRLREEARA